MIEIMSNLGSHWFNKQSLKLEVFLCLYSEWNPRTGRDYLLKISSLPSILGPALTLGWGYVGMDLKVSGEGALPPTESCGEAEKVWTGSCLLTSVRAAAWGHVGPAVLPCFSVCSLYSASL